MPEPFRPDANGEPKLHVMSEKCSTCVFRPGNLMHLAEGRLKDLIDTNLGADTAFACHQTLKYGGYEVPGEAICRGYFDAYGKEVTPLRVAQAFNLIAEQDPPIERKYA